jgi:hypothetical protein
MADVIYKVFVSSTYEDLREERAEVQKALLKMKCLPVGMELFPSADEETWTFIQKQIEDSDYYVLVVAGRYGALAPDGNSYTEKEYDYAREIKKQVISFIHGKPGNIVADKLDLEMNKREKLEKFIKKIKGSPVNFFTTPHELALEVLASFVDLRERHPATGFVRADQAVDYKRYAEVLDENRILKETLAKIEVTPMVPFLGSNEQFKLDVTVGREIKRVEITWSEIFIYVANPIISGKFLEQLLSHEIHDEIVRKELFAKPASNESIDDESFLAIKRKLYQIGLIELKENAYAGPTSGTFFMYHWATRG